MKEVDQLLTNIKDGLTLLISNNDLNVALASDTPPQLLDIRQVDAYNEGHIPGAVRSDWTQVGQVIEDGSLDPSRPVVVACYTGQSSMQVATLLKLKGYEAYSLLDGMALWPYAVDK